MLTFAVVSIVLVTAAVVLATIRKFSAVEEGGNSPDLRLAAADMAAMVDRWGKVVTGVAVLYCLAILTGFLYIGWQNGQQILK